MERHRAFVHRISRTGNEGWMGAPMRPVDQLASAKLRTWGNGSRYSRAGSRLARCTARRPAQQIIEIDAESFLRASFRSSETDPRWRDPPRQYLVMFGELGE